ncbi:hypothetical protein ACWCW7_19110 [Nocardia tengchongensis]
MKARNLTLATAAFASTFWAPNLIGPLSLGYIKQLDPPPGRQSLPVATPVPHFTLRIGRDPRRNAEPKVAKISY